MGLENLSAAWRAIIGSQ